MSKEILYPKQKEILNLMKDKSGIYLSLRDMAEKIGVNSPNTVLHHIHQLEKKGYLRRNPKNPQDYTVLKSPIEDLMYVNVYEMGRCGVSGLFDEDNVLERIPLSTKAFGVSNEVFFVKARDDKMEPRIFENDLVLAVRKEEVYSGQIAVIMSGKEPKIKKVVKAGKYVILESLNAKYPPEVIEKGADFHILGQVKNVIHFFT